MKWIKYLSSIYSCTIPWKQKKLIYCSFDLANEYNKYQQVYNIRPTLPGLIILQFTHLLIILSKVHVCQGIFKLVMFL